VCVCVCVCVGAVVRPWAAGASVVLVCKYVSMGIQHSDLLYIQGIHKRMAQFQMLTKNLFLTLHGLNLHRQQRQLS
jgi:hypothetical protein